MKIKLLVIGKTDDANLNKLIETYQNRLKHYIKFELQIIPDIKNVKNLSQQQQKEKEGFGKDDRGEIAAGDDKGGADDFDHAASSMSLAALSASIFRATASPAMPWVISKIRGL